MDLQDTFLLFCENAAITIEDSALVQAGTKFRVSRQGEEAYMTLYNNGNSLPQGRHGSPLLTLLQTWSNVRPGTRQLSEDDERILAAQGMPDFYMSWRDWKEDASMLRQYIRDNGEPDEAVAPDNYKMHREVMFHDYMFKKATELKISLDAVRHIIKSWLMRFCFMNIDGDRLADEVIAKIAHDWRDEITADGYVSFYFVTEEIAYVFTRFCQDKWIVCNNQAICPQMGNIDAQCIIDLVDSMYVYCQNQQVLSYTKTNMHRLLKKDFDNLSWIDLKADSPIEAQLGDALYQSGILTIPQYQALAPARKYRVDYLVKTPNGGALAIECDGLEYHATPAAYIKDRQRDNLLTANGFQVLRFSSVDIMNNLNGCIQLVEQCYSNCQHSRVTYSRNGGLGYFGANI